MQYPVTILSLTVFGQLMMCYSCPGSFICLGNQLVYQLIYAAHTWDDQSDSVILRMSLTILHQTSLGIFLQCCQKYQKKKENPIMQVHFKLGSCLLISNWSKQITWSAQPQGFGKQTRSFSERKAKSNYQKGHCHREA